MKKIYLTAAAILLTCWQSANAQSAIDAYTLSQPDMKGTARFMSMGGAFGALGGDLSSLSQNPAGIGVYRSSEVGFTLDLDLQHSQTNSSGLKTTMDNTRFLLNNIGTVLTLRLNSEAVPNLNFGFTYNKSVSFNRRYRGGFNNLQNSMSNYIAGVANSEELTVGDVTTTSLFDPYNPNDGGIAPSWIAVLGYDSYLISPTGDPDYPTWEGQWGDGTSGAASYSVEERGAVDSYNIAIGGNISNIVYWGMDFDITSLNYSSTTYWGENLTNAYVDMTGGGLDPVKSNWSLSNQYAVSGTGFNYKLGVIVKPIQQLRLGFAFHTPTYYSLTEAYTARTRYSYEGEPERSQTTNDGFPGNNYMRLRTPWRIIASAAGVIGSKFIISADYEWANYGNMKFSSPNYYYWDAAGYYDDYALTNSDISAYYCSTNTIRIGAEYRITPQWSVRAGYSFVSSPVRADAKSGCVIREYNPGEPVKEGIYTAGTNPSYRFDNTTNYVTVGLGYRINKFYVDLAYVYKHISSDFHAYTPDPANPAIHSPQSALGLSNSQLVLSCGFKFF